VPTELLVGRAIGVAAEVIAVEIGDTIDNSGRDRQEQRVQATFPAAVAVEELLGARARREGKKETGEKKNGCGKTRHRHRQNSW
jgi:hypothetical protein